ncbi:aminodeoxychorismate/anthranilate synthase component II [Homoserinimonas sp. OAct 916]|uniref:aminodeoxychorismate/anthranilate synthase component II n=1 Tax=Homoserinimonas sp. OAct 916 TaxID=2211450 RepID=UPI000DBE6B09|nr:aminodeoxychorismate/anthranilate synthase component II [Homoserinimonas sp. OAct 916]
MTRVLVIDNYDSFVYTLNGYLGQLGADTHVVRNDQIAEADLVSMLAEFDGVLLSPGPGTPEQAGISVPMVHAALDSGTPLFGVCLGHQAIASAFGATVAVAAELMHGKTSEVTHDGSELFLDVPTNFIATRYHSLAVVDATMPAVLRVTARTDDGVIMGLQHRTAPLYGVQFHPESVLTEGGYTMLGNWLERVGCVGARDRARTLHPLVRLN